MTSVVPSIRIRPAPESDPPYDDAATAMTSWRADSLPERMATQGLFNVPGVRGVQGVLALPFRLPSGIPAAPRAPAWANTSEPRAGDEHGSKTSRNTGNTGNMGNTTNRVGTRPLPPARPWACRFTQALVEVLSGTRPPAQLARWTSESVYDQVSRRATREREASAARRFAVRSIRLSLPREDATEVCAVVRAGERSQAIALRLEGLHGHWLCTNLEIG